jgi:hypothetical protein
VTASLYSATVTYRDREGRSHEEVFPVRAYDQAMAIDLSIAYVLRVLKHKQFELRVVGA